MWWLHVLVVLVVLLLISVVLKVSSIIRVAFALDFLLFYTTLILAIRMISKYRGKHSQWVILFTILFSLGFLAIAIYLIQIIFS